jgi:hypothetical protein
MLEAGERVLVMSSDFGSNGLKTVKNELKRRGKSDLVKNLRVIDVSTYEDVVGFFEAPTDYFPEICEFDPTVFVWEGFSSFNVDMLDEYILSMAPGADNAGEMRHQGWTHTKQDWQGMKRGTVRTVRKFLAFVLPNGKRLAKVLTALEAQPDVNDLTQKTERSVLVHGTGKSLMGPAFDAIFQTFKEEKDGKVNFFYRTAGEKVLTKSRGYQLKPVEEGDPTRLWKILTGKQGQQDEKENN